MNLMISSDALRAMHRAKATAISADILFYAVAGCALGNLLVARSARGVCAVLLGDIAEELTADLARRFPRAMLVSNEAAVKDDLAQMLRYLERPAESLHFTLDMRGTSFQRRVWEKLKAIPVGKTVSYMELARWVGPLANRRAVASACAANPIALAIPCHRVVRGNGDLAGYRWGIERKRVLIQKEALA